MTRTTWIAICGGLLAAAVLVLPAARFAVAADEEPEFPHGDFEEDCSLCHGDEGWSPAVISPEFDHGAGGFPLEGRHAELDCQDCHMDLDFTQMELSCADCHDVPHGKFDKDCRLCHSFEGFSPARIGPEFDHADGGFPLKGSHAGAQCRHCHKTLEFGLADPSCVTCHMDVHRGELGTDCERCHTPRNFIDRTRMIREHSTTRFPLNGTHLSVDCEDCHVPGERGILQYVNTPWQCVDCHLEEYQSVEDPNHVEIGFPTDCQLCHSTQIWSGARFNHTLIPPDAECRDCHLEDYLATTEPNHQEVNFPETCDLCHNTRSWDQGEFEDHDAEYFPIYSGVHRGRWDACSDCHFDPSDYSEFTCFNCHNHNQERIDGIHEGEVDGYVYDSNACYACHPDGRADDDD